MALWAYPEDEKIVHRLTYDDILIRPGYSTANSRLDCTPKYDGFVSPIMLANMDTLTTLQMAKTLSSEGILVPFHRFQSVKDQLETILAFRAWKSEFTKPCIEMATPICAAVGLPEGNEERFERIAEHCGILFLDVAYANTEAVIREAERIRKKFDHKLIGKLPDVGSAGA